MSVPQQILDWLAQVAPPIPPEEFTLDKARDLMDRLCSYAGPPQEVAHVETHEVGHGRVRVYRPAGSDSAAALPVLVYIHGGAFYLGTLDNYDVICRELANRSGAIVASVEYRLAPMNPFPAAVDDCYAALEWVAGRYPGVPLAVGGDSAGGCLSAAMTIACRDRGGPKITMQALIYPVADHLPDLPSYTENDGLLLSREALGVMWAMYVPNPEDLKNPLAVPSRAATFAGLPPAVVITAEHDPLRDEGEAYAKKLADAGVPVTLTRYPQMIHGFLAAGAILPQAHAAMEQVAAALKSAFASSEARSARQ
jgi:acetyl esterase